MKTWRFYAFGDMRLDDIELAACPPDHVLVEPLVVQPSATEAQLAFGIPTLAYDHVKSRLETDAPLQLGIQEILRPASSRRQASSFWRS